MSLTTTHIMITALLMEISRPPRLIVSNCGVQTDAGDLLPWHPSRRITRLLWPPLRHAIRILTPAAAPNIIPDNQ